MEFKTELKQLLDLIIHSLYTKKEIFLRELISNAADAIDKVRFESLTNPDLLEGNSDWKIKLIAMKRRHADGFRQRHRHEPGDHRRQPRHHRQERHARVCRKSQRRPNAQNRPELIGQFGVGFYASFMVADRVTVISRMAGRRAMA
jgi:molecular chaperone HtpG